jgi:hypothetical protein
MACRHDTRLNNLTGPVAAENMGMDFFWMLCKLFL